MSNLNSDKIQFIFGRRSIRVYAPGEVSDETVTRLLEAAMAAPSAMTKDPWRFIVVRNPQTLGRMAGALPGGKMLSTATLGIVVCGDLEAAFEKNLSYLLQDCSAGIENLLLAAHGLGLGACWVGVHPSQDAIASLKEMFALPPQVLPIAVISLGQPGETLEARTRFNEGYVRRESWQ
jgi:nitroreductase